MGFLGFGRKYTKEELQREIHLLAALYRQAIGVDTTTKSRIQLRGCFITTVKNPHKKCLC